MDWGSKANLDGILACRVKIVRRLFFKISQISEWKETEKLFDISDAEKIKKNSIRDRDWVCGCVSFQFPGAPPREA